MNDGHEYKVIWIDDRCDEFLDLLVLAEQDEKDEIDIHPFKLGIDGLRELKSHPFSWDGVILDVKCLYDSTDAVDDSANFYRIKDELLELKHQCDIPLFVYSGQPDYVSNTEFYKSLNGIKLYKKEKDEQQLLDDIKVEADNLVTNRVKNKYLKELQFPEFTDELTQIFVAIERGITNEPNLFPMMRKILEDLMKICSQIGLLPFETKISLNSYSSFLGRKEMKDLVPLYIQRSFHSCVEITNDGAHRAAIDKDVSKGDAPFLIRSTGFELLNIITWLGSVYSKYKDDKQLRRRVIELTSISGEVLQDADGIYYCKDCIIKKSVLDKFKVSVHSFVYITQTKKISTDQKYNSYAETLVLPSELP